MTLQTAVVVSLYATTDMCWFGVCWGHDTDVSGTGMWTGSDMRKLYT
jgi:hypothetical protein